MFCVFPVYVDCSNSFSYGVGFSKYASFDKTANVGSKNADFWNREEVSSVCCLYWNESSRNVLCSGLGSLTTVLGDSVIFCFSICGRKTSSIFNLLNIWWWTDFVVSSLRDRQPFVIPCMFGFCLNAMFSFSLSFIDHR